MENLLKKEIKKTTKAECQLIFDALIQQMYELDGIEFPLEKFADFLDSRMHTAAFGDVQRETTLFWNRLASKYCNKGNSTELTINGIIQDEFYRNMETGTEMSGNQWLEAFADECASREEHTTEVMWESLDYNKLVNINTNGPKEIA